MGLPVGALPNKWGCNLKHSFFQVCFNRAAPGTAPAKTPGGQNGIQNGIAKLMAPISFADKLQAAAAVKQSGRPNEPLNPLGNGFAAAPKQQQADGPRANSRASGASTGTAAAQRQPKEAKAEYYELSSAQEAPVVDRIEYTLTPAGPQVGAAPARPPPGSAEAGARRSGPGSRQEDSLAAGSQRAAGRPDRPRSASRSDENRPAGRSASGKASALGEQIARRSDEECSPSGDSRHWEGRGVARPAATLSEGRAELLQPTQAAGLLSGAKERISDRLAGRRSPASDGSPSQPASPHFAAAGDHSLEEARVANGRVQSGPVQVLRQMPQTQLTAGPLLSPQGTPIKTVSSSSTQVQFIFTICLFQIAMVTRLPKTCTSHVPSVLM